MANVVVPASACERFPVGTVLSLYPATSRVRGTNPSGTAVNTGTMTATGVTISGATVDQVYVVHATVSGEQRYMFLANSSHPAQVKWREKVAARRTAIGTS